MDLRGAGFESPAIVVAAIRTSERGETAHDSRPIRWSMVTASSELRPQGIEWISIRED
jgi:hypothetical protein